jgi:hypothetical protein
LFVVGVKQQLRASIACCKSCSARAFLAGHGVGIREVVRVTIDAASIDTRPASPRPKDPT